MGRDTSRQSAAIPLMGRKVEVFRPTEGQLMALVMARKTDTQTMLIRLWAIVENLFVDRAEWDRLDDALVSGTLSLKDAMAFVSAILQHDWPALDVGADDTAAEAAHEPA